MRIVVILSLCTLFSITGKSQTSVKTSLSGMILVTTDKESAYLTMGGPGIKVTHGSWHGGIYMLPSLRFKQDNTSPDLTTVLGSGVVIGYKRLLLGVPFYYLAGVRKWKTALGLGVRFGK